MTCRLNNQSWLFSVGAFLFAAALFWLLRSECYSAESTGDTCLRASGLLIGPFIKIGEFISRYAGLYFGITIGIVALLLGGLLMQRDGTHQPSRWRTLYILTILFALGGEAAALGRAPWLTLTLHLLSFCTAIASFAYLARTSPQLLTRGWIESPRSHAAPRRLEIAAFVLLFLIIGITRFHALNRVPSNFDGEGCTHRPVTTSWQFIFEQEAGEHVQQSSGMSWPIMHRWFTRAEHPTLFYLDERVLGAAISFAACFIVFLGFRYLCGPFTALLATVTYAFGPLDLGWSRLPVLHHFPVAIGLLLAGASFSAFGSRTWKSFIALCVLIALTKFVYPSAKLLAAGPFLGMCAVLVWHRETWRGHKRKLSFIVLGVALFLTLRPFVSWLAYGTVTWLGPFPVPQADPLADSTWGLLKVYASQAFGFLYELFYGPFDLSQLHWTPHATIEPLRSVASISVVFATLALVRLLFLLRHPFAVVSIGLIVGGLLPGIASGLAERRIAFTLVFVSLLAVIEASWFINTCIGSASKTMARVLKAAILVCVGLPLLTFQTSSFLSRPASKNMQLIMTEEIRPLLRDGTLVVQPGPDYRCEMFYGIYDILKAHEGRIGYTNPYEANQTEMESIAHPRINPEAWHYRFTDVKSQLPTLMGTSTWPRYLFVTQYTENQAPLRELLEKTYPHGKTRIIETTEATRLRFLVFDSAPE